MDEIAKMAWAASDARRTVAAVPSGGDESVRGDQTVSQMAQEVLMRQAKALSHRSGQSLEDARQAVSDTQAGRQLRDLAQGEHSHKKARSWQADVFWDRAEQRMMRLYSSEALSRIATEDQSTRD